MVPTQYTVCVWGSFADCHEMSMGDALVMLADGSRSFFLLKVSQPSLFHLLQVQLLVLFQWLGQILEKSIHTHCWNDGHCTNSKQSLYQNTHAHNIRSTNVLDSKSKVFPDSETERIIFQIKETWISNIVKLGLFSDQKKSLTKLSIITSQRKDIRRNFWIQKFIFKLEWSLLKV